MSELRVNSFKSRTGLGTVTVSSDGLNVAGIITAASMTITGAASVGGVLTYEDVTSVDSVGIVTAQNGLHVTGGRVGVGTDDPTYLIDAHTTSGNSQLRLKSGGDLAQIILESTDTSGHSQINFADADSSNIGMLQYFHSDNHMEFTVNSAERLRITSTGLIDASTNTTAVALPQGTTAQRPSGSAPYIRKNTTNNALEYYDGTSWVEIITDYFPTGSTILG